MTTVAFFRFATLARRAALAFSAAGVLGATPAFATTFVETGDAGPTIAGAQVTTGAAGSLTDIFGSLASSLDADLYVINITNPAAFSATTLNATGGFLDTQLFLLTLAGAPLYVNDDDAGGLSVLSTLPASSGFASLVAGKYLLGVSLSGYDPVNTSNQLLFATGLSTAVRGAAPGLSPVLLGGFFDSTYYSDSGSYDIQLTGASVATVTTTAPVPEPEISMLLAAGGLVSVAVAVRRRRRAAP